MVSDVQGRAMADLKKLEEDAVNFAQQAISLDQQGLNDVAFFYYCVSMVTHCFYSSRKCLGLFMLS